MLPDLDSLAVFVMITEERRRDRLRRISLGEESAKLNIISPAVKMAVQIGSSSDESGQNSWGQNPWGKNAWGQSGKALPKQPLLMPPRKKVQQADGWNQKGNSWSSSDATGADTTGWNRKADATGWNQKKGNSSGWSWGS